MPSPNTPVRRAATTRAVAAPRTGRSDRRPAPAPLHARQRPAAADSAEHPRAVAAAALGDRDALRRLYERYAENVYGYALSILRDHHEAEDVTQQVFAKLIGSLARYEDRGVPFLSWLMRMTRNAAIDQIRSRRTIPIAEPIDTQAADGAADRERRDTLRSALGALPADQREIIVLRHVGGFAPAEIAARLGRSESAVNGLHHRGRRTLRAELTRLGAAPATRAA